MAVSKRVCAFLAAFVLSSNLFLSAGGEPERRSKSGNFSAGTKRDKRIFNIFQIVTFPNDPCSGTANNGTCYTAEECLSRGGTNSGDCASGFGVCCTFTVGCGTMSSENCTYFTVSGAIAGECTTTICPCGDNICQLRLDFNTFSITGPSTVTTSAFTINNGQPSSANAVPVGLSSNCLTDTFSVTSPDTAGPPVICGTNNGEHMYLDSSQSCNDLTFQIGTATSATTRSWNIKVTQYSCNFDNLAPVGCTQYFFGSTSGSVMTYNHQSGNGRQLANQNQAQCFRRERGNCRICFSVSITTDFVVSGPTADAGNSLPSNCCAYGADGMGVIGYDCLIIPNAVGGGAGGGEQPSRYCGGMFGDGTTTRCTSKHPFHIRFMTDGFENAGAAALEANNNNVGYMIDYFQNSINC